jgi:hypothetical protein
MREWQTQEFQSESGYRNALALFLRERLSKDTVVETEYRHSGTTIDIYVKQPGFLGSSEVFIELKRNLLQKAQLDRLVGQIESLPSRKPIIVVLCGETNPALVMRFKQRYKLTGSYLVFDLAVVVKRSSRKGG